MERFKGWPMTEAAVPLGSIDRTKTLKFSGLAGMCEDTAGSL
jgi:hypothetical protein